jgi:hypothetical protein
MIVDVIINVDHFFLMGEIDFGLSLYVGFYFVKFVILFLGYMVGGELSLVG